MAEAEVIVVAAPLTGETEALLDARRLGRMKRGAWLVNVARGPLVDARVLVAALETGALAGAALDVFAQEPLPAVDVFIDNLARWDRGEARRWPVDAARGY